MKKIFCLIFVVIICFSFASCSNKIDNLISQIATLENKKITLEDEELIDKIYDKSLDLSEEEKSQITNYDILGAAVNRVGFLSRQQETMQQAPMIVEEYIRSCLKTPSAMKVIKTEVYASKESYFDAFVRMQYTGENAFGGTLERTCFAKVEIHGASYNRVVENHFGDAHETWEDLRWSDWLMEQIDFETEYIPTKTAK
ncbi:MAG: hypothetical protein U0L11_04680 [Acutalibacteraceae bacterium]|nr:hypothetical protein [Acutalibacteraceae bacterium]